MKFGKYRGRELQELPSEYLEWLTSIDLREPLRGAVFQELEARELRPERSSGGGLELAEVKRVYRTLSLKWHPDHGGSTKAQQAINEFFEMLGGRG